MADQSLDQLTALPTPLAGTDLVYVVRNSTDYKALGTDLTNGLVVGPGSATDAVPVLFDGTTGKLVKNSTPTGTGAPVMQTSPSLTTPTLGVASATTINKVTITAPATGSTLTIADGKTLTANNTLTLAGTDSTTMTFPSTSATIARTDAANTFTGHQTIEGVTSTGATGTGRFVFDGSPTLVTPVLGVATATSVNKVALTAPATAATLTIADNKTLTANASLTLAGTDGTTMTFPSTSATIARTDAANTFTGHQTIEGVTSTGATGTGKFVFDGSPTLVTPTLGVATATSVNKVAVTAPATSATLTLADGSTLATSGAFSTTLTATNTTTVTLPTTGTLATLAGSESLTNKKLGSLTSNGYVKTSGSDGTLSVDTASSINMGVIGITIDGAGSTITTGVKGYITVPYGGTIVAWNITANGSSPTCTFDVWKVGTGTALPTVSNTIMGTKPALSTGNAIHSTTLTSWTTTFSANDIFGFNLDAVTVATKITFNLQVTKTS